MTSTVFFEPTHCFFLSHRIVFFESPVCFVLAPALFFLSHRAVFFEHPECFFLSTPRLFCLSRFVFFEPMSPGPHLTSIIPSRKAEEAIAKRIARKEKQEERQSQKDEMAEAKLWRKERKVEEERKKAEVARVKMEAKLEEMKEAEKRKKETVGGCSFGNSCRSGRIPPDCDISEGILPDWKNYSHLEEFLEEFFQIGRILPDLEEFPEECV